MFAAREGNEQTGDQYSAADERGKSSGQAGKKHRRDRKRGWWRWRGDWLRSYTAIYCLSRFCAWPISERRFSTRGLVSANYSCGKIGLLGGQILHVAAWTCETEAGLAESEVPINSRTSSSGLRRQHQSSNSVVALEVGRDAAFQVRCSALH
jgi:hypothetical protein